jgi:phosphoribosyl 1,2-cyclic phosphodiesterase
VTSVDRGELLVSSLGSGSNGNAFLIEYGSQVVLLDAGVPIRTLVTCLSRRSLSPADLSAILVSHEHADHVRSLRQIAGRSGAPIFATRGTLAGINGFMQIDGSTVSPLVPIQLGEIQITPVPVSHDAREPVGFYFESPAASAAIMSDIGEINDFNAEFASRADHLVIESNYDERLLRTGSYPAYLKQRIRSADGHLSNDDCAAFLKEVVRERTTSIWLCHLSENNNLPELALQASSIALKSAGLARDLAALPRYDGTIVTWRSSDPGNATSQVRMRF